MIGAIDRSRRLPTLPTGLTWVQWRSHPLREPFLAVVYFVVLAVVSLGPTLFSGARVFSNDERDLALQFIHWRKFGFDLLRAGHLALWNPHIYGGTPFFGGFQSALLYPPNWLYLVLPLAVAVNTGIALHIVLTGCGMYAWMRARGLHPLACLLAGSVFVLSGPVFPHIYAGHLSNLCTMAWAPWIFLAIDGWLRWRTGSWLLLGSAVVAMQMLAGHPQYVFYTGLTAAMYCAAQLTVAKGKIPAAAGLALLAVGGVALSAVQLFEGFHAAGESVRNQGTSREFAAIFSFPPENFLTLLTPYFFGDLTIHDYWGRWNLWEMSIFFSVGGLFLLGYGLARGPRFHVWTCFGLAATLLVLATGEYTPLFGWLYDHAPGFGRFRGWSKFTFPAMLLLVVVAAEGCDVLAHRRFTSLPAALAVLAAGSVFCLVAAGAHVASRQLPAPAPQPWNGWIHALSRSGDQYLAADRIDKPHFVHCVARQASRQLLWTALTLLALAGVLLAARRHPRVAWCVPLIAVFETVCFARSTLDSFSLDDVLQPYETTQLAASAHEGFRMDDERNHNAAMSFGGYDLWGYDPGVLRRYAEWMAASQDRNPDSASETIQLTIFPPVFSSLLRYRCRGPPPSNAASSDEAGVQPEASQPPPAPRIFLGSHARVIPNRDEELDAVFAPYFDPVRTVLLESPPDPSPSGAEAAGQVRLLAESTDTLTIEADLTASAILLITDNYSDGWKARSLLADSPGSGAQTAYRVVPADYCLRAVPLTSGHHKILLEYQPTAFVVGAWVSVVSLLLYLAALVGWIVGWGRRARGQAATSGAWSLAWPRWMGRGGRPGVVR